MCGEGWRPRPAEPAIPWSGPEEGCEGWEACLQLDGADILAAYLEAAALWMKTAEATCKEPTP